jgi:hypothetical protein
MPLLTRGDCVWSVHEGTAFKGTRNPTARHGSIIFRAAKTLRTS